METTILTRGTSDLPVELRRMILTALDLSSLKVLRLASKTWALSGEEYLISPVFKTLPQRNDIDRLVGISEHPLFSGRIREICFNHGEVNEYHVRHNIHLMICTRDPEHCIPWKKYLKFKEQKEKHLPTSCDTELLTSVFSRLPNLRQISVTLMKCPFPNEEDYLPLRGIWEIPSTRLLPRVATTERFTNILNAIVNNITTLYINRLSHDRLPFEFFAQKSILTLSRAFHLLTSISLTLDYSDMPNNIHRFQAFENLALCLGSASSLQTLDLAFQGQKKIEIEPMIDSFQKNDYVFKQLEQLSLQGIVISEASIGNFLVRQKNNLRQLRLGGIGIRQGHQPANGGVHLKEGRFVDLFEHLAREMELTHLELLGDFVETESGESWLFESVVDGTHFARRGIALI